MEAKETIGDGSGRKYVNSQFSNQNRQDALQSAGCRLCRIAREARDESTDGLAAENTRSHQQGRLRRNGNDIYGCLLLHQEAPV